MLPDGSRIIGMIYSERCLDPAQHLVMAGYGLDILDHDLSDLSDLSDVQWLVATSFPKGSLP